MMLKTNLDFTEARDSEWQWHQLGPYASLHGISYRPLSVCLSLCISQKLVFHQNW